MCKFDGVQHGESVDRLGQNVVTVTKIRVSPAGVDAEHWQSLSESVAVLPIS